MGRLPGYKGKVTISGNTVAYVKSWDNSGAGREMLDGASLGDSWESLEYGIGKGGTVTLEGHYDPTDTNGQVVLRNAFINGTKLDKATYDPRLYYSATGYLVGSTGMNWLVETFDTKNDGSGLVAFTCTIRVSDGYMSPAA